MLTQQNRGYHNLGFCAYIQVSGVKL
jgi:hypothetical protein